ncbi:MAG: acyl carrier protein [Rubrivivax sp.]
MSSLKELQDLVQERFGIAPAELGGEASLRDHGMDSLAVAELLYDIEDRLHVTLPERGLNVDTLAGLAAVVDHLRASQAA